PVATAHVPAGPSALESAAVGESPATASKRRSWVRKSISAAIEIAVTESMSTMKKGSDTSVVESEAEPEPGPEPPEVGIPVVVRIWIVYRTRCTEDDCRRLLQYRVCV